MWKNNCRTELKVSKDEVWGEFIGRSLVRFWCQVFSSVVWGRGWCVSQRLEATLLLLIYCRTFEGFKAHEISFSGSLPSCRPAVWPRDRDTGGWRRLWTGSRTQVQETSHEWLFVPQPEAQNQSDVSAKDHFDSSCYRSPPTPSLILSTEDWSGIFNRLILIKRLLRFNLQVQTRAQCRLLSFSIAAWRPDRLQLSAQCETRSSDCHQTDVIPVSCHVPRPSVDLMNLYIPSFGV